jgi:predicted GNAT family N-acyltransferase
MKVIHINSDNEILLEEAKRIRIKVFVEEQNVPFEEDWDGVKSENYLIYKGNKPVGTMRWRELETKIKIERVAVLLEYRNKGIGTKLVRTVIEEIRLLSNKPIILHSQILALPLYKRLNFEPYGEIFYEANIAHYAMEFKG